MTKYKNANFEIQCKVSEKNNPLKFKKRTHLEEIYFDISAGL